MSDTIRVQRVPGRLYPDPRRPGEFVGLRKFRTKTDKPEDVVYSMPDGPSYVDDGPCEVPATREIRKALVKGDLVATPPTVATTRKRAEEKG